MNIVTSSINRIHLHNKTEQHCISLNLGILVKVTNINHIHKLTIRFLLENDNLYQFYSYTIITTVLIILKLVI